MHLAGGAYKAVEQSDYIAVVDRLEDIDLALQILEELGRELLSRDRFDRDWRAGFLLGGMVDGRATAGDDVVVEGTAGEGDGW